MSVVSDATGRAYHLFDYHGAEDAARVVVIMGSAAAVVKEAVDYLIAKGEKVGVVCVHLYRPWSIKHFLSALPSSALKLAVLDRTKESGSLGEPLYLDVCSTLMEARDEEGSHGDNGTAEGNLSDVRVVGGRYGLGSKEFTPTHALAVFENLSARMPKNHFTIGIEDDVNFSSLHLPKQVCTVPQGTTQCMFWGMGSDGTVGANHSALRIIGEGTNLYAQGYFAYDAHKSGGVTVSHLRFGPSPITSHYLIEKDQADYLAIHNPAYLTKYNFLASLKKRGTLVLNVSSDIQSASELEAILPSSVRRGVHLLQPELYCINARTVSDAAGLGKRISTVMQTVFFYVSNVMPMKYAVKLLKESIMKTFNAKGPQVVRQNFLAVDSALARLVKIPIPDDWKKCVAHNPPHKPAGNVFVDTVVMPMLSMRGDSLPVSAFLPGGTVATGTSRYEKRGIASQIPAWTGPDACSQCNVCSLVCPHAAIRPYLVTDDELDAGPAGLETRQAKGGSEVAGLNYRVQVSVQDCLGCELCFQACPDNALTMVPINDFEVEPEEENWEFCEALPERGHLFDRETVKGSQFQKPLLEFSGACEGCGETPYVKLLTQLFGERMIIANATGCSSIWGGSAPVNPYTTTAGGEGPAWANSLFEDNAQFGFGIAESSILRRNDLAREYTKALRKKHDMPADLHEAVSGWVKCYNRASECRAKATALLPLLQREHQRHPEDAELEAWWKKRDLLVKPSVWSIGGDGWSYDIGYGGLDHVMNSGVDMNILVLDTQMYSNTGGQMSKATPLSAVVQFAAAGKKRRRKDLGMLAMTIGDVYVASVCLGANYSQVVRAFMEAESYPGTSLILAYSPCILHGMRDGMSQSLNEAKMAVETGYWPLYRYDPRTVEDAEHRKLQFDSRRVKASLIDFLKQENRFTRLERENPLTAEKLRDELERELEQERTVLQDKSTAQITLYQQFQALAKGLDDGGVPGSLTEEGVTVLFGSETGTTQGVSYDVSSLLKERGVGRVMVMQADELRDLALLGKIRCLLVLTSTTGQGEFPDGIKDFWQSLSTADSGAGGSDEQALKNVNYAVFGLGDSAYPECFFCRTAVCIDERLKALGANRLLPRGIGDDQEEGRYETGLWEWLENLWPALGIPSAALGNGAAKILECPYTVEQHALLPEEVEDRSDVYRPPILLDPRAYHLQVVGIRKLTQEQEHRVCHIELDISPEASNPRPIFSVGNSLAVFPQNSAEKVKAFLKWFGLDPETYVTVSANEKLMAQGQTMTRPKLPLEPHTKLEHLFTDVLDIFGRPSKRFYTSLLRFLSPQEASQLELLVDRSAEGKAAYAAFAEECPCFADVMRKFGSCKEGLSLSHLIDIIPAIKPRYYSIASSRRYRRNRMDLCVTAVEYSTASGGLREGLCSNYLTRAKIGQILAVSAKPSAGLHMPQRAESPIICAALGTGIAPMRAIVQERRWQRRMGKSIGPTWLFFGCRHEKGPGKDYLYGEEWPGYLEDGTLQHVETAFSRDGPKKVYVQHRLADFPSEIWSLLVEQKGYFFFCGSRSAVSQIREAVETALCQGGHITSAMASSMVGNLIEKGRYVAEAWS